MNEFLSGVLVVLSLAIAAFQVRFWRTTRDRLFLFFALAFVLLSVTRGGLFIVGDESETRSYFYLVRFVAFMAIIAAVIDKNRRTRRAA